MTRAPHRGDMRIMLQTVIGVTAHGREAIDAHNAEVFENSSKRDLYCQFGFVPEIGWRGK
jgi:hypothetical protein